jgi:hypothetical protein
MVAPRLPPVAVLSGLGKPLHCLAIDGARSLRLAPEPGADAAPPQHPQLVAMACNAESARYSAPSVGHPTRCRGEHPPTLRPCSSVLTPSILGGSGIPHCILLPHVPDASRSSILLGAGRSCERQRAVRTCAAADGAEGLSWGGAASAPGSGVRLPVDSFGN